MMDYFRKLPGFRRSPYGLERRILRKLPLVIILGTIIPSALVFVLHWSELMDPKLMDRIIIFTIGLVSLHWSFMITIGIAAFIVMLMKGPAYVADPYYPPDFKESDNAHHPLDEI